MPSGIWRPTRLRMLRGLRPRSCTRCSTASSSAAASRAGRTIWCWRLRSRSPRFWPCAHRSTAPWQAARRFPRYWLCGRAARRSSRSFSWRRRAWRPSKGRRNMSAALRWRACRPRPAKVPVPAVRSGCCSGRICAAGPMTAARGCCGGRQRRVCRCRCTPAGNRSRISSHGSSACRRYGCSRSFWPRRSGGSNGSGRRGV